MKRWHRNVKKMRKESKIAQSPWLDNKVPPKPLGKFRKRHALDCGKTDCLLCHYDKVCKKKSHKETMEDLRTKEQLNEASCIKDVSVIPKGPYCHDENGLCPYWHINKDKPKQQNGYCAFLEIGDWEVEIPDDFPETFPVSALLLLWDQVKECSQNMDEENDETE